MSIKNALKNKDSRAAQKSFRETNADGMSRMVVSNNIPNSTLIKFDELVKHPDNRTIKPAHAEELADSIDALGLLTPLRVTQRGIIEPDKYTIISGAHRWSAIQSLREKDPEDRRFDYLPCIVSAATKDYDVQSEVYACNIENEPTAEEIIESAEKISRSYDDAVAANENIPEKKKSYIINKLSLSNLSKRQAYRYVTVALNAADEVKAAAASGQIALHTAEELTPLDKETQIELLDRIRNTSRDEASALISAYKKEESKYQEEVRKLDEAEITMRTADGTVAETVSKSLEEKRQEAAKKKEAAITSKADKENRKLETRLKQFDELVGICRKDAGRLNEEQKDRIRKLIEELMELI